MYGSEKQINWAEDIIANAMNEVENIRKNTANVPAEIASKVIAALDEYCAWVKSYTHASDVINDRDFFMIRLAKAVRRAAQ